MEIPQRMVAALNAFIEDTCVIFSVSYLLSRGRSFASMFRPADSARSIQVGLILGLAAASEVIFPGMRSPYVTDTLVASLAGLYSGWLSSTVVGLVVVLFALVERSVPFALETGTLMAVVGGFALLCGQIIRHPRNPVFMALVCATCQAVGMFYVDFLYRRLLTPIPYVISWSSIPANAFGIALVIVVIRDAEKRLEGERNRLDIERLKTLQIAAELAALRSRIHPHFLFNALTAIASLCGLDPIQAEKSILKLSRLMRQTLSVDIASLTTLEDELDYVRAYVDIQILRFGDRVKVSYALEPAVAKARLPAFGIQTLVENAFQHGFEKGSKCGTISIIGRRSNAGILFAVLDTGLGIDSSILPKVLDVSDLPRHGMGIIDRQLRLMFGKRARLRIFSEFNVGTLIGFRVPNSWESRGSQMP